MTIRFKKDRIEFEFGHVRHDLVETPEGFRFSGTLTATQINEGFQGTAFGFISGGFAPSQTNTISRFPFARDSSAVDFGDLVSVAASHGGASSSTHGYTIGGQPTPATPPVITNAITKFPFAASSGASDVGDLVQAARLVAGNSSSVSGYRAGGFLEPTPQSNVIERFSFSYDGNSTDVGDLTRAVEFPASQNSFVSGYASNGWTGSATNVIEKFPFASDANATDVGDLTGAKYGAAGQSSTVNGYTSGGNLNPGATNVIDKFPFAADTNATDVGDLTSARNYNAGSSSTTSGYNCGGTSAPTAYFSLIDKFSFASNANATNVGDLTNSVLQSAGHQD